MQLKNFLTAAFTTAIAGLIALTLMVMVVNASPNHGDTRIVNGCEQVYQGFWSWNGRNCNPDASSIDDQERPVRSEEPSNGGDNGDGNSGSNGNGEEPGNGNENGNGGGNGGNHCGGNCGNGQGNGGGNGTGNEGNGNGPGSGHGKGGKKR